MSVSVKIHPNQKLVLVECLGVVTDDDWLEAITGLWSDSQFDRGSDKLIDTRGVEHFDVASATIFSLGARARKIYAGCPRSKTAIVAPLPDVHGVARQHQLLTEGIAPETQVFWTYDEACVWLGKRPDEPLAQSPLAGPGKIPAP